MAAAESGTGSLAGAAFGPYGCGEQTLALDLLPCFGPGMLVLADRNFLSWSLARDVLATGAHILWRASASFTLKPARVLPDGTYLAELKPPRKADGPPIAVRVIEYTVHTTAQGDGGETSSEVFCLVTDLLDPEEYPALDLACCYPERWGCETVIGHHKTDMGEGSRCCAARTPRASPRRCGRCSPSTRPSASSSAPASTPPASPRTGSASRTPWPPRPTRSRLFPPDQLDLALATFLLKILMPGFFVRDRPDRASPRKTKKAGDFPARKPGEPSVTTVTRRIEFHLLQPWHIGECPEAGERNSRCSIGLTSAPYGRCCTARRLTLV